MPAASGRACAVKPCNVAGISMPPLEAAMCGNDEGVSIDVVERLLVVCDDVDPELCAACDNVETGLCAVCDDVDTATFGAACDDVMDVTDCEAPLVSLALMTAGPFPDEPALCV